MGLFGNLFSFNDDIEVVSQQDKAQQECVRLMAWPRCVYNEEWKKFELKIAPDRIALVAYSCQVINDKAFMEMLSEAIKLVNMVVTTGNMSLERMTKSIRVEIEKYSD